MYLLILCVVLMIGGIFICNYPWKAYSDMDVVGILMMVISGAGLFLYLVAGTTIYFCSIDTIATHKNLAQKYSTIENITKRPELFKKIIDSNEQICSAQTYNKTQFGFLFNNEVDNLKPIQLPMH